MFCKNCGNQLNEGAAFCPKCGSAVTSEDKKNLVINSPQGNLGNSNRKRIMPLVVIVLIVLLVIIVLLKSSSVEKELKGYWFTSYYSEGYEYTNQIEIKKSDDGYEGISSIWVEDGNGETVYSEGYSFSGEVVVDKSSSTVKIENKKMGEAMCFNYTESGGKVDLELYKYWCEGGDPFINNLGDQYRLKYKKIKD